MPKVLFCGDVDGKFEQLSARIHSINASANGPFALLLCVGKFYASPNELETTNEVLSNLPIDTYILPPAFQLAPSHLPPNIHLLRPSGTQQIQGITIGTCAEGDIYPAEDLTRMKDTHFKGMDIFISADWPREFYHFLQDSDLAMLKSEGKPGVSVGSSYIAELVSEIAPRYHFASLHKTFFQRSPYRNADSRVNKTTRFIALANVNESKEKDMKYLHALSVEPLAYGKQKNDAEPVGTTDNPFVKTGASLQPAKRSLSSIVGGGGGGATKRLTTEDRTMGGGGMFRFGNMGVPMETSVPRVQVKLTPPTSTARTLFIANLPKNRFKDSDLLGLFPGAIRMNRPEGKSYCFVDMDAHEHAKNVVDIAQQHPVTFYGRQLSIGWSSTDRSNSNNNNNSDKGIIQSYLNTNMEANMTNTTLYVGNLPIASFDTQSLMETFKDSVKCRHDEGNNYAFMQMRDHEAADRCLKEYLVNNTAFTFKGNTLIVAWGKSGAHINKQQKAVDLNTTTPSNTLYIGNLPAGMETTALQTQLQNLLSLHHDGIEDIKIPEGKCFAFVTMRSEVEATMVINSIHDFPLSLSGQKLGVGYAKGKAAASSSHVGECWFCLASKSVKTHLIASVGESCYIALPRGGMHDYHVLIIPIACIPSRIHMSDAAKEDLSKYEMGLQKLYESNNASPLRFERSIRTKGKDHMQIQIIPIAAERLSSSIQTFMQTASDYNLKFSEISDSDGSVDEVVMSMEGGPYQEYFYIEIPISMESGVEGSSRFKRFVYVHADNNSRFPMHFGVEVAAKILGEPAKANWKNCLVSEKEEGDLCENFKRDFEKFDFALMQ